MEITHWSMSCIFNLCLSDFFYDGTYFWNDITQTHHLVTYVIERRARTVNSYFCDICRDKEKQAAYPPACMQQTVSRSGYEAAEIMRFCKSPVL